MKKILFLCLLLFGCEIGIHPVPTRRAYVTTAPPPTATVVVTPTYTPYVPAYAPYNGYKSPVWCDEYCCLYEFDEYYSVCEELWCDYYDGYGWELEYEQCYPI
jgi:hypothetical protein